MLKTCFFRSFLLLLLLFLLFPQNATAQNPYQPADKDLAQLIGLYDSIKVPISETSISLQIQIYRNNNPVGYEDLDPNFVAKPQETIDVGKMEIYPENDDSFFFLFALQRLSLETKTDNIIYWGLKREGSNGEGVGTSAYLVDSPEFKNPEFNWTFGLFPNIEITTAYSPVYIIKGLEKQNSGTTFSGLGRDDLNIQVQMHDIIIVINCGAGI